MQKKMTKRFAASNFVYTSMLKDTHGLLLGICFEVCTAYDIYEDIFCLESFHLPGMLLLENVVVFMP
jgi:hypothetical protein